MEPDRCRDAEIKSMIKLHKKLKTVVTDGFRELYKNQSLCDLTLVTSDGKNFGVHKVYMAVVSDYFKAMFKSGMVESRSDTVTLHNVESRGLEGVLSYLYTGFTPTLFLNNVKEIMNAAALLLLPDLVQHCALFLARKVTITTSNVMEWMNLWNMYSLSYPDKYDSNSFHEKILDFLKRHLYELAEGELTIMVPDIHKDDLIPLLSCWTNFELEIDFKYVYGFMERWLEGDIEKRSDVLCHTIKRLDFFTIGLMPPEQLKRYIVDSKLAELPLMKEILKDVFKYHSLPISQKVGIRFKDIVTIIRIPGDAAIVSKRINCVNDKNQLHRDPGTYAYNQILVLKNEWNSQLMNSENEDKWKWFSLKVPVPENLYNIDVVSVNNFLMVGNKDNGDCHIFDPRLLKWEKVETLSKRRRMHTNFTLVGTEFDVFAIGGRIRGTVTDVIKKFSWQNNKWEIYGKLPEPLENVGGLGLSKHVYVVGGKKELNDEYVSDMFCIFKTNEKSVVRLAPLPLRLKETPYICEVGIDIVFVKDHQVQSATQHAVYSLTSDQWRLFVTDDRSPSEYDAYPKGKFQVLGGHNCFLPFLMSKNEDMEHEHDDAIYEMNHWSSKPPKKVANIPENHFYTRGGFVILTNTKDRMIAL